MADIFIPDIEAGSRPAAAELLLATVSNYNSSTGTTLILDGSDQPTTKRYKRVGSASFSSGDRVLVTKISGTYLILGRIY